MSPQESPGFGEIGVDPAILKILDARKITKPTPIQHQAIPLAIKGKDLIGVAQTGTGKTFAFGLPMLQQMKNGKKRGLIILPTRELAYQVEEALKPYASVFGIRTAVFVGGVPIHLQRRMIKQNPRILIATPGRLNDHLERGTVSLKEVEILVLDEADRMLDMGFKPQINKILAHVPKKRQTLLFSATMPQEIVKLATSQMNLPLRIEVAREGTAAAKVEQELIIVRQQNKQTLLKSLLREHKGKVLVFSRTKHGAKKITRALNEKNYHAAEIHSNRSLAQRRKALEGFKRGTYRVLVATDIASRGIDVTDIELVINYDLPDDPSDYVHRIGRTGRADREGLAISFATPTQAGNIRDIERLIRTSLIRKQHESLPNIPMEQASAKPSRRPHRPARRSNSHKPSSGSSRSKGSRKFQKKGPGKKYRGR
jgi:ATP-dependent RNA helicase RhlE